MSNGESVTVHNQNTSSFNNKKKNLRNANGNTVCNLQALIKLSLTIIEYDVS